MTTTWASEDLWHEAAEQLHDLVPDLPSHDCRDHTETPCSCGSDSPCGELETLQVGGHRVQLCCRCADALGHVAEDQLGITLCYLVEELVAPQGAVLMAAA